MGKIAELPERGQNGDMRDFRTQTRRVLAVRWEHLISLRSKQSIAGSLSR
jgi:hypothetical protein